jgi:hypothetical protein
LILKLIPKSENNVQKTYEVPDEIQANKNKSIILNCILMIVETLDNNPINHPT